MNIFRITNTLSDYFEKGVHILFYSAKFGIFDAGLKVDGIVLLQIISQYLKSNKRLVIPQLGAFIVKQPDVSVVFSELLNHDDGVLRGLLCAEGLSEVEAAGEISRLVFEVRHAVEHGHDYPIPGLGLLHAGANSTIAFTYQPSLQVPDEEDSDRRKPKCNPDRIAENMKHAFDEPYGSPSIKLNPDPSVKGLRYGRRPHRSAQTYIDGTPRRRADRFVWIAIFAAVIALGVIAFGYWRSAHEKKTQIVTTAPAPAQSQTQSNQ